MTVMLTRDHAPTSTEDGTASLWLPIDGAETHHARVWASMTLRDLAASNDTIDDAVLMLCEIVSNVAWHTTSRSVRLTITDEGPAVRVTVAEQTASVTTSSDWLRAPAASSNDATSGRGLGIVDALAQQWGITRRHRASTVWFVVIA